MRMLKFLTWVVRGINIQTLFQYANFVFVVARCHTGVFPVNRRGPGTRTDTPGEPMLPVTR